MHVLAGRDLQGQSDSSSMHQLARYLQQQGAQYFPDLQAAKYAEFWAHCRRHSSGTRVLAAPVLGRVCLRCWVHFRV